VDGIITLLERGDRVCAFPLTTGTWYTVGGPSGLPLKRWLRLLLSWHPR